MQQRCPQDVRSHLHPDTGPPVAQASQEVRSWVELFALRLCSHLRVDEAEAGGQNGGVTPSEQSGRADSPATSAQSGPL